MSTQGDLEFIDEMFQDLRVDRFNDGGFEIRDLNGSIGSYYSRERYNPDRLVPAGVFCVRCRLEMYKWGIVGKYGAQRHLCAGCHTSYSNPIRTVSAINLLNRKPRGIDPKRWKSPTSKSARYQQKMKLLGRCPHCGRPCAPFSVCEDRRAAQRRNRAQQKQKQGQIVMRPTA